MRFAPGLIGGLLSICLGLAGNRLIWCLTPRFGTGWLVPLWEESVKTGLGLLTHQLVLVHCLFGLGEGVFEACRQRWGAGALAFLTHLVFGVVTYLGWRASGSAPAGWLGAALAHLAWNHLVLRFAGHRPSGL